MLSNIEVHTGFKEIMGAAREGQYNPLALTIAEEMKLGDRSGVDVLGVQFALDAVLAVVNQPSVQGRLPAEVLDRSEVATQCSSIITEIAIERVSLLELYGMTRELDFQLNEADLDFLGDNEYFDSLVCATIEEATRLAGGAHRVLNRRAPRPAEAFADIIGRSTGLLAVSGVSRANSRKVWNELGYPYVLPKHLVVDDEVKFEPGIRKFIANRSPADGGCPAAKIKAPDGRGTVMANSWQRLTSYLVPEHATTHYRNTALPPPRERTKHRPHA